MTQSLNQGAMKKYFIPYLCLLLTILLGSCRINNQMTSEKELSNIKKVLTASNLDLAIMTDVKNQQKKLATRQANPKS